MTTFVVLTISLVAALILLAKLSDAAKDGTLRGIWGHRSRAWSLLRRWVGTFVYISLGCNGVGGMIDPDSPGRGLPWWTYWITAPVFLICGIRRIAEDVLTEARDDALRSIRKESRRG